MNWSPTDRVTVRENVIFRALGGEAIVVSLDGGVYFGLDEVGTRIWQLLEAHDLGGVAEALASEYDVDRTAAEADVLAFVDTLCDRRLVERTDRA